MRAIVESIQGEYRRYEKLAEAAIQQIRDEELSVAGPGEANSVAIVVWHISGNLKSRFTDFLTSDGEKPWRRRDEEFDQRSVGSAELQSKWNEGWDVLFRSLDSLTDNDLQRMVTVRGEQFTALEALHRSVTHTAYHVGQIVHMAKTLRGPDWKTLTIPRGKSQEYNANPVGQRP
jgi:uncharacterized damage-inducible protein DinB